MQESPGAGGPVNNLIATDGPVRQGNRTFECGADGLVRQGNFHEALA